MKLLHHHLLNELLSMTLQDSFEHNVPSIQPLCLVNGFLMTNYMKWILIKKISLNIFIKITKLILNNFYISFPKYKSNNSNKLFSKNFAT